MRAPPEDFDESRLAHARIVTRGDGARLGFTDHDRDLVVDGVTCRASAGWSPGAAETAVGYAAGHASALGVLDDPAFAEVFGPGSMAEAAIAGTAPELPDGLAVSGRVDRMLVAPDRVLVADFKTNRRPPADLAATPVLYLRQMASYRAVLRAIFPDRRVVCALVWTRSAEVAMLPDPLLDPHDPETRARTSHAGEAA